MNKIFLDRDYYEIPKEEDIYFDELDIYLEKIKNALDKGKISRREAAFIMEIILKKTFKNELTDTARIVLGKRQRIKKVLFFQSSNKIEQYG